MTTLTASRFDPTEGANEANELLVQFSTEKLVHTGEELIDAFEEFIATAAAVEVDDGTSALGELLYTNRSTQQDASLDAASAVAD
jgi:hypothetical protein